MVKLSILRYPSMTMTSLIVLTSPLVIIAFIRWWQFRNKSRSKERDKDKVKKGQSIEAQESKEIHGEDIEIQEVASTEIAPDERDAIADKKVNQIEMVDIEEKIILSESRNHLQNAQPSDRETLQEYNYNTDFLQSEATEVGTVTGMACAASVGSMDFPFLIHPPTRDYIEQSDSKVIFIMRGLSGSGKSTIVDVIKSTFQRVAILSADHFFYKKDGTYAFDANGLSSAHGQCQQRARDACQSGTSVVVIDNTNVKRWEMKPYLEMAKANGYVVVLVEPKTPWRLNAKELASRNKHGVTQELLARKVSAFADVIPLYYGWFFNESSSKNILDLAHQHFRECLGLFSDFREDIEQRYSENHRSSEKATIEEILSEYYSQGNKTSPLLHCTSHFCNGGKISTAKAYHSQDRVQRSYGQVHSLTITGLTMTKNTLGARVTLDRWCASIYERPEEEGWVGLRQKAKAKEGKSDQKREEKSSKSKSKSKSKNKKELKIATSKARRWGGYGDGGLTNSSLNVNEDCLAACAQLSQVSLGDHGDEINAATGKETATEFVALKELFPQLHNSGKARSAHVTLKTSFKVESKQTNLDVLSICDIEQRNIGSQPSLSPVLGGQACYYGDGVCCVYFNKPLVMDALFSGYY